jgi:hypothetical protein
MKNFIDFLTKQKKKIEEHKWLSSEKAGHDLGQEAVMDWVKRYAKKFRKEYTMDNIKDSISELKTMMKDIKDDKICAILQQCMTKLEDAEELLETEPENGKNGNGKTEGK